MVMTTDQRLEALAAALKAAREAIADAEREQATYASIRAIPHHPKRYIMDERAERAGMAAHRCSAFMREAADHLLDALLMRP